MAAITVAKYLSVAADLADAQTQVAGVSDYYYNAAYEIVVLTVFDPEIDLLVPFYNAYLSANAILTEPPSTVVTAVNRLQNHVLSKATYTPVTAGAASGQRFTNINDWLAAEVDEVAVTRDDEVDDSPIKVPCHFAVLSEKAGYSIDDANVDPATKTADCNY